MAIESQVKAPLCMLMHSPPSLWRPGWPPAPHQALTEAHSNQGSVGSRGHYLIWTLTHVDTEGRGVMHDSQTVWGSSELHVAVACWKFNFIYICMVVQVVTFFPHFCVVNNFGP